MAQRQSGAVTFYYVEMIVGAPLFMGVFSLIATSAIPDPGGRPIGIGAAVLAVVVAYLSSRTPYLAAVGASGRGGASWIFFFNGGSAQLGGIAGRQLARYVVLRNSLVEYPAERLKI